MIPFLSLSFLWSHAQILLCAMTSAFELSVQLFFSQHFFWWGWFSNSCFPVIVFCLFFAIIGFLYSCLYNSLSSYVAMSAHSSYCQIPFGNQRHLSSLRSWAWSSFFPFCSLCLIIFNFNELYTPNLTGGFSLSLSDSKTPHVYRTLLSSWSQQHYGSMLPQIYSSHDFFSRPNYNWNHFTFQFCSFYCSLARSKYWSFFYFLSFSFCAPLEWQNLLDSKFFSFNKY